MKSKTKIISKLAITLVIALSFSIILSATSVSADVSLTAAEPTNGNSGLSDNGTAVPTAYGATPSKGQLDYHKSELASFVHYGMNPFFSREWGQGSEATTAFNIYKVDPVTGEYLKDAQGQYIRGGEADADQWVKILAESGWKRVILVCKHHDGFCFWPTATTSHNVSNATSKGDIVKAVSDACRKYGVDMGVYVSP